MRRLRQSGRQAGLTMETPPPAKTTGVPSRKAAKRGSGKSISAIFIGISGAGPDRLSLRWLDRVRSGWVGTRNLLIRSLSPSLSARHVGHALSRECLTRLACKTENTGSLEEPNSKCTKLSERQTERFLADPHHIITTIVVGITPKSLVSSILSCDPSITGSLLG